VFVAGLAFDFCVLWSAEETRRRGFETVVVEDACRAVNVNGSAAEARLRLTQAGVKFASGVEIAATRAA
jgi:nicotinamidase/pyrazinamidase